MAASVLAKAEGRLGQLLASSRVGFGVLGLGFRVWGLVYAVLGLRFSGLVYTVLGLGFGVSCVGFEV